MKATAELTAEQEAQAQELATRLSEALASDVLAEAGLSPHRLTPGAERVTCLLGATGDSFEEAAQTALPEACGLRLGESTVQRTCEDAGTRLGRLLEDGHTLGERRAWQWHPDATG